MNKIVPRAVLKPAWASFLLWQVLCRERDSNPHNHSWSRDFKSLVSTNSTITAAVKSVQRYGYFLE